MQGAKGGPLAVFNVKDGRQERREKSLCNEAEAGLLLTKLNELFVGRQVTSEIHSVMILSPYKGQVRICVLLLVLCHM